MHIHYLLSTVMILGPRKFKICFTIKCLMPSMCLLLVFFSLLIHFFRQPQIHRIIILLRKCNAVICLCGLREVPDTSSSRLSRLFSIFGPQKCTLSYFYYSCSIRKTMQPVQYWEIREAMQKVKITSGQPGGIRKASLNLLTGSTNLATIELCGRAKQYTFSNIHRSQQQNTFLRNQSSF